MKRIFLLTTLLFILTLSLSVLFSCKKDEPSRAGIKEDEEPAPLTQTHECVFTQYCSYTEHFKRCVICDAEADRGAHSTDGEYCTACDAPTTPDPDILYTVSDDGTYAVVTGYTGENTKIRIAEEYNGVPVKEIGELALSRVMSHGKFNCPVYLTMLIIPDGVTHIGAEAFRYSAIENVVLPANLEIGKNVFEGYDLKNVAIPDGITEIGTRAFYNCQYLESISLPDSLIKIGQSAFFKSGIKSLNLPSNLQTVEYNAFSESDFTTLIIPEGITSIAKDTFMDCTSLTAVSIPSSVTTINERAFYGCSLLTDVRISDGVSEISYDAFSYCTSLTKFSVSKNNALYMASGGDIYARDGKTLVMCAPGKTEISIPKGVTAIGDGACAYMQNLTKATIPDGITAIGDYAFMSCFALTSIDMSDSVKTVGDDAFATCYALEGVRLSNNLTHIGVQAFLSCIKLTDITIPDSVTVIGGGAFSNCTRLSQVKMGKNVVEIGYSAFAECYKLSEITLPATLTTIGRQAFFACFELKQITVPASVTSMDWHAFEACQDLTIHCEVAEKPDGWNSNWYHGCKSVVWGSTGE